MQYRKFRADQIFNGKTFLPSDKVLIINHAGMVVDIIDVELAGENIEYYKGIISPSFINCHCHLELSHLKNRIPQKTGLVDFVFKIVNERHFPEEEILSAIITAENEMKENGIGAVGDISNNALTLSQKLKRQLQYYNFIETSGWNPEIAAVRFAHSKQIYDQFETNGLITSIVPHAPYSVSENLWQKIVPLFKGKTISIHNQETAEEDLFFEQGKGGFVTMYEKMNIDISFYQPKKTRSPNAYFKKLQPATSVMLVHNTFTNQQDIDFIKENSSGDQHVYFCLCPNANLYIENALPDVSLFLKNNLTVVLGTDSLASNYQLCLLEEIKTIAKHFPDIPSNILLQWATSNGAKALQLQEQMGTFEKGKTPGVVLIENVTDGKISAESKSRRLF
jgi:aminodeoxyfutalosine deaminase